MNSKVAPIWKKPVKSIKQCPLPRYRKAVNAPIIVAKPVRIRNKQRLLAADRAISKVLSFESPSKESTRHLAATLKEAPQ
jgi:hypothetical protein